MRNLFKYPLEGNLLLWIEKHGLNLVHVAPWITKEVFVALKKVRLCLLGCRTL
jgi:hypothetical protein